MARPICPLEAVLFEAGLTRRQAHAVKWSLLAAGDTVPHVEDLAGLLLKWKGKAVREAVAAVGYEECPFTDPPMDTDQLQLWPQHPTHVEPPPRVH